MSLSRILNDEPAPPVTPSSQSTAPSIGLTDVAPVDDCRSSASRSNGDRTPTPRRTFSGDREAHRAARTAPYQHENYADPAAYGAYDEPWPQGPDVTSLEEQTLQPFDGYVESSGRRKRRNVDDDADYQPPGQKRNGTRRYPSRSKQARTSSPSVHMMESVVVEFHQPTEEELRLASSDLSDSEEVWIAEYSDYILETQKRQRQVEAWFDASCLERNSNVARHLSHHYAERIASIPPPPPPPPPIPIMQELSHISNVGVASPPHAFLDDQDPSPESSEFGRPLEMKHGAEGVSERSALGSGKAAGLPKKGKGKQGTKRSAALEVSDSGSELDVPLSNRFDKDGPTTKKRKIDKDMDRITEDVERSIDEDLRAADSQNVAASSVSISTTSAKGKGKGKQAVQGDFGADGIKPPRKKPGPKRKIDALPPHTQELLGVGPGSISASRDGTPSASASRPASPAPTNTSSVVYELDEQIPPLKRAKKVDDAIMAKRVRVLEEAQKKVWTNISKREVAKVYKYHAMGYQARQAQLKRLAMLSSIQARRPFTRTAKASKDVQAKSKRLMREMLVFWKKNEKEERDVRKREQKEAHDRARIEEERREAARQARKLEFLISQTELYSHFVGSKLKTAEVEGDSGDPQAPAGANLVDDDGALKDIDFDDEDQTNLHRHARKNAQDAIALAKLKAREFDKQAALERKTNEALQLAKSEGRTREESDDGTMTSATPLVDLDSDELNFQNPTSLSGPLTIKQPQMLTAQLKEYQLKGLNWLATLYDQGINGILADEMGLGKTVQSISLLAYLAEVHDIWGPFLVVAPASTLHNWQQEITRFVPPLKALPYWGNVKDRATLRKFWSKKEINYDQDAPFHVLITSYQLVTQDQQYFQRVKWQYMVLDEAQNIKNSSSVRWKTLLGFNCRNRLLLTGTPIQNNMQELWALLHFIMPSLFDSHDEFNEWFSKDIENAAENKGSKLNEHQLRRLHMILKPFMLRRVKRHVQNELSDKIEKDIYVDMSARQRALYRALLANVSVADLLEKAANIGDAESARTLMNLVMQFRKVCNHPELFERADVIAPFSFSAFGQSGPLNREGDLLFLPYSSRSPIEYAIPGLFYRDGGLLDVVQEDSSDAARSGCLSHLMNIWTTDWIHKSLYDDAESSFAFLRLSGMTSREAHDLHISPLLSRRLSAMQEERNRISDDPFSLDSTFSAYSPSSTYRISTFPPLSYLEVPAGLPALAFISKAAWQESCLSRQGFKFFVPPAIAPPITMYCSDRTFLDRQEQFLDGPLESLASYGLPTYLKNSEEAFSSYQFKFYGLSPLGLLGSSSSDQLPLSTMQVPDAKRLIYDSAKLARLDSLLQELKAESHRVLIYFQMTRMMDLMEEYLIYRQYKYLRLDGSSKLEDRRDMVIDWQTKPEIFVFLLSTRAGGLGINLTAADTVVFYDHDWNPSNDAQAMDRAHRLGQTRQVTVYRLITKGTIDERIVQLARVKKDVQDIVVGNKSFTDVTKPNEIVSLLLPEDQLADLNATAMSSKQSGKQAQTLDANGSEDMTRDLWNDEGDEFFGHPGPTQNNGPESVVDDIGLQAVSGRGKKRKPGAQGAGRGRRGGARGSGTGRRKLAVANVGDRLGGVEGP
ncbi:hypothetical protein NEOLEDRAFT_1082564 [Neolentinus lepideus HHB14362 ss-1]|uniref:Chromatin-remodeling ATPase INO80 n=1 Tax=Neolentinus lepideus HHB14362 ss-1 TaxID=1314782 RepID=A0A165W1H9_9AGAM|nr:hypothetical protein NEOLEDRAFT_1082564 [Neolentinus lepideus HHB14362 ss-1]